jgi:hypothetical protein
LIIDFSFNTFSPAVSLGVWSDARFTFLATSNEALYKTQNQHSKWRHTFHYATTITNFGSDYRHVLTMTFGISSTTEQQRGYYFVSGP